MVKSLDNENMTKVNKEDLLEILKDVNNYDDYKKNIIYNKFLKVLEKDVNDKTKLHLKKRYNYIIKSIDALIEGLSLTLCRVLIISKFGNII